jgi:hypothetical protein
VVGLPTHEGPVIAIWNWLTSKRQEPTPPPEGERRRAPRQPCSFRAAVRLISLTTSTLLSARACDLSAGGIGLVCSAPMPVDRFIIIAPHDQPQTFLLALRARVVRCVSLGGGRWLLGCALVEGLSDEQLHLLA